MSVVTVPRKVLMFQYKQHKFYGDPLNEDAPFTHVDNKGRTMDTEFYSEDEVIAYFDSLETSEEANV